MKSMTGFGKEKTECEHYEIDVEIKTVNHRFLDMQLRMPKEANSFELAIRQKIKERLQRGRVEVFINLKKIGEGSKAVHVHWSLIHQLLQEIKEEIYTQYGENTFDPSASLNQLLNNSDYVEIVEGKETDAELESCLLVAVEAAINKVDSSRYQEGEKIKQILFEYSNDFSNLVARLGEFTELYESDYRDKFEQKLRDWLETSVDETRLLTEMAILLEKGDIHEELDRLAIHINKLEELLEQEEPVGRELDFLIQEINREVNTIGSKSSPIEIKNYVVQLKTILEKIREQIQNIE